MTGVSEAVNEHLVEENRRLREALKDAREVADLLRQQAKHHNDMSQEIRILRRAIEQLQYALHPVEVPGNLDDYEIDKFGNYAKKSNKSKSF